MGATTVDWEAGTLTAQGGSAADMRMPSADLARPGAERRARAAAIERLRVALAGLPLGGSRTLPAGAIERAVARATTVGVEYQSNGGAIVRLQVRFSDWREPPADGGAPRLPREVPPLVVAAMPFEAAPVLMVGDRELQAGAARYRSGSPPSAAQALRARRDAKGRLVIEGAPADLAANLAGAEIVIYVQKISR